MSSQPEPVRRSGRATKPRDVYSPEREERSKMSSSTSSSPLVDNWLSKECLKDEERIIEQVKVAKAALRAGRYSPKGRISKLDENEEEPVEKKPKIEKSDATPTAETSKRIPKKKYTFSPTSPIKTNKTTEKITVRKVTKSPRNRSIDEKKEEKPEAELLRNKEKAESESPVKRNLLDDGELVSFRASLQAARREVVDKVSLASEEEESDTDYDAIIALDNTA